VGGRGQRYGPVGAIRAVHCDFHRVNGQRRGKVGQHGGPLRLVAALGLSELPREELAVGLRVRLGGRPQHAQVAGLDDQGIVTPDGAHRRRARGAEIRNGPS